MQISVLAHALSTDLRDALESARRLGFGGVVLDPTVFKPIVETSQTARREIIAMLGRSEQPLVGIDVRLQTGGFGPSADLERELDRVTRAMDVARGLRCSLVLCDLGPLPPAPNEPAPKPVITEAMRGKIILPDPPKPAAIAPPPRRDEPFEASIEVALRELGIRSDRHGCRVALRSSLGSFASLSHLLSRVDCPYFGVDLDPLAMLADEWSADEILSRLGSMLAHVRGRDGHTGAGNRVIAAPLGKGAIPWRTFLAQLRDASYRGSLSIDPIDLPNRASGAAAGLAALQALG